MKNKMNKLYLSPRARMPGVSARKLQEFLFRNHKGKFPKYFADFARSADLMKIYKMLIYLPKVFENGIEYDSMSVEDKIDYVFGSHYRHILTYKACSKFELSHGEIVDTDDSTPIPSEVTIEQLRTVYEGDLVLVRVDNKDESNGMMLDIQVLTCGLFQTTEDDFRQFKLDREDFFKYYRKNLELKDLGSDYIKKEEDAYVIST